MKQTGVFDIHHSIQIGSMDVWHDRGSIFMEKKRNVVYVLLMLFHHGFVFFFGRPWFGVGTVHVRKKKLGWLWWAESAHGVFWVRTDIFTIIYQHE